MVVACGAAGLRTALPLFPLGDGTKVKVAGELDQRYIEVLFKTKH